MKHPILSTLAAACLAAVLGAGAPAAEALEMVLELDTDYVAGVDYHHIHTGLHDISTGAILDREIRTFFGPVQRLITARFEDVSARAYQVRFDLLDRAGRSIASSAINVTVDPATNGCQEATNPVKCYFGELPRPVDRATKFGELLIDEDGDGDLSPGDVARFHINVQFDEIYVPGTYIDEIGTGLELIAGSVVSTSGTVHQGNRPSDTSIRIDGLDADTLIVFDARVRPEITNQGEMTFDVWRGKTDDPDTPALRDATVREVQCTASDCQPELARCQNDLDQCNGERAVCQAAVDDCEADKVALAAHIAALESQYFPLIADTDRDGVGEVLELCAGTPLGDPVDDRGCSQQQFCNRIDVGQPQGNALCTSADWLGDEPLGMPLDCRRQGQRCVAR